MKKTILATTLLLASQYSFAKCKMIETDLSVKPAKTLTTQLNEESVLGVMFPAVVVSVTNYPKRVDVVISLVKDYEPQRTLALGSGTDFSSLTVRGFLDSADGRHQVSVVCDSIKSKPKTK